MLQVLIQRHRCLEVFQGMLEIEKLLTDACHIDLALEVRLHQLSRVARIQLLAAVDI